MMLLINALVMQYMHLCETILNNFLSSLQDAELGIVAIPLRPPPAPMIFSPAMESDREGGRMGFGGRERLWPGMLGRWLADLAMVWSELDQVLITIPIQLNILNTNMFEERNNSEITYKSG